MIVGMPTLRQLEVFRTVCDEDGSVTRAAAKLFVSQPSVSDTLRTLERELGSRLFAGRGHGRGLTAAGRIFVEHVNEAFAALRRGQQAVADLSDEPAGRLEVVAVPTAAESFIPAALGRFAREHHSVEISLRVANRSGAISPLVDGGADLGVMGRPPTALALEGEKIMPNRLLLVGAPGDGCRDEKVDLAHATLLVREPGSGTRLAVEQALEDLGIRFGKTMVLGSNAAILAGVREGLGLAVLPEVAVLSDLERGALVTVAQPGFPLERHWYALWSRTRELSRPARGFIAQLRQDAEAGIWIPRVAR